MAALAHLRVALRTADCAVALLQQRLPRARPCAWKALRVLVWSEIFRRFGARHLSPQVWGLEAQRAHFPAPPLDDCPVPTFRAFAKFEWLTDEKQRELGGGLHEGKSVWGFHHEGCEDFHEC